MNELSPPPQDGSCPDRPVSCPTIATYDRDAATYALATRGLDVSPERAAFLALLPERARILDAGCGSGRDTLAFRDMGHEVSAFDASHGLAAQAGALTGLPIRVMRFQDLDDEGCHDGIWAMSSLLHVPSAELDKVFGRLHRALVPGGVLFCCFKDGDGERRDGERHFTDLDLRSLEDLAVRSGFRPERLWSNQGGRAGARSRWSNLLARKA